MSQRAHGQPPTVSIVAYVYNYEGWVDGMIESVLGQTYRDFEFFFLDDGSTDGTGDVVGRYSRDPRLRYERQERRGRDRLHETFNRCLEATCGEFIAIANGDDVLEPDKIARQVELLESRPEIDVCFHDAHILDGEGRPKPGSFRPPIDLQAFETGRLAPHMFQRDQIPNPTVMFRRSILRRIGLQEYGWPHDYQFWLKAAVAGCRFHFLPERLIRYRVHEDSHSTSSSRLSRLTTEVHRMLREMRSRYAIVDLYPEIAMCQRPDRARAIAHFDLGLQVMARPDLLLDLAEEEFRSAVHWDPYLGDAQNNLGVVLLLRGQTAEAVETLEKAGGTGQHALASRNLARIRASESQGYELAPLPAGEELSDLRAGPALRRSEDPPEATVLASIDESDDPAEITALLQAYFAAWSQGDPVGLVLLTTDEGSTGRVAEIHQEICRARAIDPRTTPLVYVEQVRPGDLEAVAAGHLQTTGAVARFRGSRSEGLERLARAAGRPVLTRSNETSLRELVAGEPEQSRHSPTQMS